MLQALRQLCSKYGLPIRRAVFRKQGVLGKSVRETCMLPSPLKSHIPTDMLKVLGSPRVKRPFHLI